LLKQGEKDLFILRYEILENTIERHVLRGNLHKSTPVVLN
jgi:hypothetical protein